MAAPQTPGGSVLIDPTSDNEMQKIPVGNGLRLMLALGIGHALFPRLITSLKR